MIARIAPGAIAERPEAFGKSPAAAKRACARACEHVMGVRLEWSVVADIERCIDDESAVASFLAVYVSGLHPIARRGMVGIESP